MILSEPRAYRTGDTRPGAVELVIFLPPGVYAAWMREVGFPLFLKDLYDAHPDRREQFDRMQEDHLAKVQEHVALAVLARVVGAEAPLPSAALQEYLREGWGIGEVFHEAERDFPAVLLHGTPAKVRELLAAGDIRPHRFTWDPAP